MPRIRSIKPETWEDEVFAQLSPLARLLFIGTWNLADDSGRLRWTPEYISASLFMYDGLSSVKVRSLMAELERCGRVRPYQAGTVCLAEVVNFSKHQVINRAKPSKFPDPPPESLFDSLNDSVTESRNGSGSVHNPVHPRADARAPEEQGAGSREMEQGAGSRDIAPVKPARERDELWDAAVACYGYQPKTDNERGRWNKHIGQLRSIGAEPDEIPRRRAVYRQRFPNAADSLPALVSHWGECEKPPAATSRNLERARQLMGGSS